MKVLGLQTDQATESFCNLLKDLAFSQDNLGVRALASGLVTLSLKLYAQPSSCLSYFRCWFLWSHPFLLWSTYQPPSTRYTYQRIQLSLSMKTQLFLPPSPQMPVRPNELRTRDSGAQLGPLLDLGPQSDYFNRRRQTQKAQFLWNMPYLQCPRHMCSLPFRLIFQAGNSWGMFQCWSQGLQKHSKRIAFERWAKASELLSELLIPYKTQF
jgi:hypothetical protein